MVASETQGLARFVICLFACPFSSIWGTFH
jgi:hypothetical protein